MCIGNRLLQSCIYIFSLVFVNTSEQSEWPFGHWLTFSLFATTGSHLPFHSAQWLTMNASCLRLQSKEIMVTCMTSYLFCRQVVHLSLILSWMKISVLSLCVMKISSWCESVFVVSKSWFWPKLNVNTFRANCVQQWIRYFAITVEFKSYKRRKSLSFLIYGCDWSR